MERAVTYNINNDFVKKPSTYESASNRKDELSSFLEYINMPENTQKFKSLNHNEKIILYYYDQLDRRNQEDILTFMKVKYLNGKRG